MQYQDVRSADFNVDFYSDPRERKMFHCKLFMTLFIQFVVVGCVSFFIRSRRKLMDLVYKYKNYLMIFSLIGVALLLLMLIIEKIRRLSPLNMILIVMLTLSYIISFLIVIETMDYYLIYTTFAATFVIFVCSPFIANYLPINLTRNIRVSLLFSAATFGMKLLLVLTLIFVHSPLLFLMFLSIGVVDAVYILMFLLHYVRAGPRQIGSGVHHPLYFMQGEDKSCETRIGIACFAIVSFFQVMFNMLLCTFYMNLIVLFQIV